jgi:hypothetical protein
MADEQGEVVIRDNDGNEHVFPAGFDPQKAAAIVRQQTTRVAAPIMTPTGPAGTANTTDSPDAPDWKANLAGAMDSAAHPQTAAEIGGLMLAPVDATRSVTAGLVPRAWQALKAAAGKSNGVASTASTPFRAIGEFNDELPTNNAKAIEEFWGGAKPPAPAPQGLTRITQPDVFDRVNAATTKTSVSPTPAPAWTPEELASFKRQGITPEQQKLFAPSAVPAAATAPEAGIQAPSPNQAPTPPSPLQGPRVAAGAERVGKPLGLTKEAVRAQTAPILGEEQGAASPILPRDVSQKIIGKLVEMGPKGTAQPEASRDAYVMAANSEKARAQIKAYLDALRTVGFGGVGALGARTALTSQLGDDK